MDWSKLEYKDILGIIADVLSIFGITVATIGTGFYAIFKRNKDYLPTMVSLYLTYVAKSVVIFCAIVIIGVLTYELILLTSFIDREPLLISLALAALFSVVGVVLMWISGTIVWTLSSRHAINFFRILGFKIKPEAPRLEILYAWYGTKSQNIDVTKLLSDAIINNKLRVKASNELAGDPHVKVRKKMVVQYRMGSKPITVTVIENKILEIPQPDDQINNQSN